MAERIILHVDMDSFYASVEMRENTALAGRPVVVGADPRGGAGRGVVCTCSYAARAFGVRSAMPISRAYALCPQAVFLRPNFPLYEQVSANVMQLLREQSDRFQQVSIDEAYLDLSEYGSYAQARECARSIQEAIRQQEGITASMGIGPCKVVAKIASDFEKPNGLTLVEPVVVREFLAPLPVQKIPGIGPKTGRELSRRGVLTIGDLAACDVQQLISLFGRWGLVMHDLSLGIDEREVEEGSGCRSVSREVTFGQDVADPHELYRTLDLLAEDLADTLKDEGLRFRTLTVKVRYQGFVTRTRARTLGHRTEDLALMRKGARELLASLLDGRKIRLLGLRLSSLSGGCARQTRLEDFVR